jgi:hypothetical protein
MGTVNSLFSRLPRMMGSEYTVACNQAIIAAETIQTSPTLTLHGIGVLGVMAHRRGRNTWQFLWGGRAPQERSMPLLSVPSGHRC